MKKPLFTDRTKLYIGATTFYERCSLTLLPCADNRDKHAEGFGAWIFGMENASRLERDRNSIKPIEVPLTLAKLADAIRATKMDGYTYLVVADCTFIWAKHTPAELVLANARTLPLNQQRYCGAPLEWFADWREALPKLRARLKTRLDEMRKIGKDNRLKYTEYITAQTTIDKTQAAEIRLNNKRFKGIPF